ncbi:hypothetical protein O3G_MSEX010588 [Manduca sexta]|uniref:Esterase n=1 Tax=Manduca sexta TaxID=7130 RepID=A0A921ZHQ0_MANSE|nr:hypothetical protein O3G_MSEX010588 [Manduca sexta]UXP71930.1 esterase [Manduca sexta]
MKILLALVLLYTANQRVSCFVFLDYVSGKWNEVAHTVATTFNDLKNKVKNFFFNKIIYSETPKAVAPVERTKKDFRKNPLEVLKEAEIKRPDYADVNSDPSILMSTPQLAILHGKRIESHVVHTRDGYLLTLHRVMRVLQSRDDVNKTVFLHHGLLGSSADWILLGSENSLPYMLSNTGYDVWMGNARGNSYSKAHTSYKVDSHEYWNFTWEEIGEHDVPASIEYIRSIKNTTEPINFIGHSMGATALLVLLSSLPRYNHYFRIGILLAPLAFMSNVDGPIKKLGSVAFSPSDQLVELLGKDDFFPERIVPEWLAVKYCRGPIIYCSNPLFFLSGSIPKYEGWNASFVARLLYHIPAGTSTKLIMHYAQVSNSGKFHRYGNKDSEFSLGNVTVPIAIISSSEDRLATVGDVLKLYFNIASPIDNYVIRNKNMDHSDMVWGSEAHDQVFNKVMEYLEDGSSFKSTKTNEVISGDLL